MNFNAKYQLLLWKSYLDRGMGLLNYFKYFIAFYALASNNVKLTLIIGVVYAIVSVIVGYYWFKYDWVIVEAEVGNRYNLFVKEMREKLKKR